MKKEISIIDILLIIAALILSCISIAAYLNSVLKPEYESANVSNSVSNNVQTNQKSEEEQLKESLKNMTERDRMEYYFSEYARYIQKGEYESAYNLLYPEFRDKYFPTVAEFEKYVKQLYPKNMTFSYNNIDRQGYIYVLDISIIDVNNKENNKSHRVVIIENDFNNFELSFQKI